METTLESTYTYTARSASKSNKALTFTIRGDRLSTDLGTPLERVSQSRGDETSLMQTIRPMITPTALWAMEQGFNTFHLSDVEPIYDESDSLALRLWVRAGGLRAFPIQIGFNRIDNPDAAEAFVREVRERKSQLGHPGPFVGLLDYWLTWAAAAITVILLLKQQLSSD